MDFVDLSHVYDENILASSTNPACSCCPVITFAEDGVSAISFSMRFHLGTHLDAPYQVPSGASRPANSLPLSTFTGPAIVVNVTNKQPRTRIMWHDISSYETKFTEGAKHGAIVLICTGWSNYWSTHKYFDHPFLDGEAAQRILDTGIKVIGIDTLSPDETFQAEGGGARPEAWNRDFGVHRAVLGSGRVIVENLTSLESLQDGDWSVTIVPFKPKENDGSPVRAFAFRKGQS